jgi:hypothetical protein
MSTTSSAGREGRRVETGPGHGSGWVAFCGTMLAIVGVLNVIYGIGAIDDAHVYAGEAEYVFADLSAWGWFLVIVGAVQVIAAFSIWNGSEFGRWIGIGSAGANAILQLLFMPAFPLLSLALFAVDVLVIYGLIQYGGSEARA